MANVRLRVKLLLCSSLMVLLAAICFDNSFSAEKSEGQPTLDELRRKVLPLDREVKTIIGDAVCTSDNECLLIGYGAKPCGGPGRYLAYSIKSTDVVLLEHKVREFNALAQEFNRRTGRRSDCMLTRKPRISCVQDQCVTR